jgi:hypothetical protein
MCWIARQIGRPPFETTHQIGYGIKGTRGGRIRTALLKISGQRLSKHLRLTEVLAPGQLGKLFVHLRWQL